MLGKCSTNNTLYYLEISRSYVKRATFICTVHRKTMLEEEIAANLHFCNISFKRRQFSANLESFSTRRNKCFSKDININCFT